MELLLTVTIMFSLGRLWSIKWYRHRIKWLNGDSLNLPISWTDLSIYFCHHRSLKCGCILRPVLHSAGNQLLMCYLQIWISFSTFTEICIWGHAPNMQCKVSPHPNETVFATNIFIVDIASSCRKFIICMRFKFLTV